MGGNIKHSLFYNNNKSLNQRFTRTIVILKLESTLNAPLVVLAMADSEKSPLSSSHLPILHHIIPALVLYAEAKNYIFSWIDKWECESSQIHYAHD